MPIQTEIAGVDVLDLAVSTRLLQLAAPGGDRIVRLLAGVLEIEALLPLVGMPQSALALGELRQAQKTEEPKHPRSKGRK